MESGSKSAAQWTMLLRARAETGGSSLALFRSTNPEIKNQHYPLSNEHGPVRIKDAFTNTETTIDIPQYGTLGLVNKFDPSAQGDANKAVYRVQGSSLDVAPGHTPLELTNGNKVMSISQLTSLVITYIQYRLTHAHCNGPSKCNGGDKYVAQFRRSDRYKNLKKEFQKKLMDGEFGSKEEMKKALGQAEPDLFKELLKDEVRLSFMPDGSSMFFPAARYTPQKTRNEETGEYEVNDEGKGGPTYFTLRQNLLSNVYEGGKTPTLPSEEITGIPRETLTAALAAGKKFNHIPLYSASDPSRELGASVRNSLLPGAWFVAVVKVKFTKTATGSDARGKIELQSLQLLQNGSEDGTDASREERAMLKPMRFGQNLLEAPPPQAATPSPSPAKQAPTRSREEAFGDSVQAEAEEQPSSPNKKRRKRLVDAEEDDEEEMEPLPATQPYESPEEGEGGIVD